MIDVYKRQEKEFEIAAIVNRPLAQEKDFLNTEVWKKMCIRDRREGYTGYVGSARKLFKKLGAIVTEIDISTEAYSCLLYTSFTFSNGMFRI